jgi:hypothetical protein
VTHDPDRVARGDFARRITGPIVDDQYFVQRIGLTERSL